MLARLFHRVFRSPMQRADARCHELDQLLRWYQIDNDDDRDRIVDQATRLNLDMLVLRIARRLGYY